MELIDDEIVFNPTAEMVGKKVMWAINNQYDVLVEKTEGSEIQLRAIRRTFL